MREYEEKVKQYILKNNIPAEQLLFEQSCHSVQEAAEAVNALPGDLVKNICMLDKEGNLIVAIVSGEDRVSTKRVGKALNIDAPRIAQPEEILEKTGFPCGGVPSFGYKATFIIDDKVTGKEIIFSGGGSTHSLVRMKSRDLLKANKGMVARIRK